MVTIVTLPWLPWLPWLHRHTSFHPKKRAIYLLSLSLSITPRLVTPRKKGVSMISLVGLDIGEGSSETENVWFRSVDHVMFPAATLLDSQPTPFLFRHQPEKEEII
eukprot:sb/3477874/